MKFQDLTLDQLANIDTSRLSREEKKQWLDMFDQDEERNTPVESQESINASRPDNTDPNYFKSLAKIGGRGAALSVPYIADLIPMATNVTTWGAEKLASAAGHPIHIPSVPYPSDVLKSYMDKYVPLTKNEQIVERALEFINPLAKHTKIAKAISAAPTAIRYLVSSPKGVKGTAGAGLGGAAFEYLHQENPESIAAPIIGSILAQSALNIPRAKTSAEIALAKRYGKGVNTELGDILQNEHNIEPNVGLTTEDKEVMQQWNDLGRKSGSKIPAIEQEIYDRINENTLKGVEPEYYLQDRPNFSSKIQDVNNKLESSENKIIKKLFDIKNSFIDPKERFDASKPQKAYKKYSKQVLNADPELLKLFNVTPVDKVLLEKPLTYDASSFIKANIPLEPPKAPARKKKVADNFGNPKYPNQRLSLRAIEDKGIGSLDIINHSLDAFDPAIESYLLSGGKESGKAKYLAKVTKQALDDAILTKGPEAVAAVNEANSYYSHHKKQVLPLINLIKSYGNNNKVENSVSPAKVLENRLFSKNSNNKFISKLLKNSDDPARLAKGLLYQIGLDANSVFNSDRFFKNLNKIPKTNYDHITSYLPEKDIKALDDAKFLKDRMTTIAKEKNHPKSGYVAKDALKKVASAVMTANAAVDGGALNAIGTKVVIDNALKLGEKVDEFFLTSPVVYKWFKKVEQAKNKRLAEEINKNFIERLNYLFPASNKLIHQLGKSMSSDIKDKEY